MHELRASDHPGAPTHSSRALQVEECYHFFGDLLTIGELCVLAAQFEVALLADGIERVGAKIAEEAEEVVRGTRGGSDDRVVEETADPFTCSCCWLLGIQIEGFKSNNPPRGAPPPQPLGTIACASHAEPARPSRSNFDLNQSGSPT